MKTHEKSEIQKLTEEKAPLIEVCPLCGSKLERGYVASKMISWSDKKISNWYFKGLFGGEIIVSKGYPYLIENVEAFRCKKCKLIIFKYGKFSQVEGSP